MLDITSENLSRVTEAIVDLLCDVADEEPFRCSSGAIVLIKLIIYFPTREREREDRDGKTLASTCVMWIDHLNLLLENQPTFVDDIVFFIEINRMPMVSDDVP